MSEKKIIIVLIVFFNFVTFSCVQREEKGSIDLKEAKTVNSNLGFILEDESHYKAGKSTINQLLAKEWLLINRGPDSIFVDSVKASCECVELSYDASKPIAPNQYFPLTVTIHPEDSIEQFYREITIYGNFQNSPMILTFEGEYVK